MWARDEHKMITRHRKVTIDHVTKMKQAEVRQAVVRLKRLGQARLGFLISTSRDPGHAALSEIDGITQWQWSRDDQEWSTEE